MGQVLKLDVIVDDHGGVKALHELDAATNKVEASARKAGSGMDAMSKGMTAAGKTSETSAKMVAGMSDAGRKLTETTNTASASMANLTGMMMRYVSAAALLGAIKSTLDYASSLDKMRASTDIGFKGIQQLENIAVSSNTTVQALTSSILDMQRKLMSGDEGAVAAVRALGMNLTAFMALKGDEQFFAVARSLGAMEDEVQRNKLAFDLFGRSYKEIMAALTSDVDGLAKSVKIMSDAQIAEVARIEAEWKKLILTAKRYAVEVVAALSAASKAKNDLFTFNIPNMDEIVGVPDLPKAPRGNMPTPAAVPGVPNAVEMVAINAAFREGLEIAKAHNAVLEEQAAVHTRMAGLLRTNIGIELERLHLKDVFKEERAASEKGFADAAAAEAAFTQSLYDSAVASDALFTSVKSVETAVMETATTGTQSMITFGNAITGVAGALGAVISGLTGFKTESERGLEEAGVFINRAQSSQDMLDRQTHRGAYRLPGQVGFRAKGGPVSAGQPYVVGEPGPELFVPKQSGTIVPPGAGATFHAGAIVVNYPVMQDTRAMDELARMIDAAISQRLSKLS